VKQLDILIEKAIRKIGFSVVEIMTNCHTQYGRRNDLADPVSMLNWFKDHAIPIEKAEKMDAEAIGDRFPIGILVDRDKPDYIEQYQRIREKSKND
jgi:2-oxoglutarate ferredoxin oxidoreductase subunit beta